jgi:hypothetical protein
MRRIIRLFFPTYAQQAPTPYVMSAAQHRQILELLERIGRDIVAEQRGPVPLLPFARRVLERLGQAPSRRFVEPVPLPHFADALKRIIRDDLGGAPLRVMSPSDFPGVGYVFLAHDPETWPVQTSR